MICKQNNALCPGVPLIHWQCQGAEFGDFLPKAFLAYPGGNGMNYMAFP